MPWGVFCCGQMRELCFVQFCFVSFQVASRCTNTMEVAVGANKGKVSWKVSILRCVCVFAAKIPVEPTGEIRMGWNDPSLSSPSVSPSQFSIQTAVKEYFKHQAVNLRRNKPRMGGRNMEIWQLEKYKKWIWEVWEGRRGWAGQGNSLGSIYIFQPAYIYKYA